MFSQCPSYIVLGSFLLLYPSLFELAHACLSHASTILSEKPGVSIDLGETIIMIGGAILVIIIVILSTPRPRLEEKEKDKSSEDKPKPMVLHQVAVRRNPRTRTKHAGLVDLQDHSGTRLKALYATKIRSGKVRFVEGLKLGPVTTAGIIIPVPLTQKEFFVQRDAYERLAMTFRMKFLTEFIAPYEDD